MFIKEIDKMTCIEFVQKYHYSKVMPKLTKHYLGLFYEDELVGALTLGWGTQPIATIRKILPNHNLTTSNYFEIGKMCIHPDLQNENSERYIKDSGTQFLSLVVRWIKKNTNIDFLYTLADGIVGRLGIVYQAFNFYYGGYFKTSVYMGPTGEKIHPRTTKWLCRENSQFNFAMNYLFGSDELESKPIFWLTPDFMKHKGIRKIEGLMFRYLKPLNKNAKKILKSYPQWKFQKDYPKEKDLVWREQIDKGKYVVLPDFNPDKDFVLTEVDWNKKNVYAHEKQKIKFEMKKQRENLLEKHWK